MRCVFPSPLRCERLPEFELVVRSGRKERCLVRSCQGKRSRMPVVEPQSIEVAQCTPPAREDMRSYGTTSQHGLARASRRKVYYQGRHIQYTQAPRQNRYLPSDSRPSSPRQSTKYPRSRPFVCWDGHMTSVRRSVFHTITSVGAIAVDARYVFVLLIVFCYVMAEHTERYVTSTDDVN